MMTADYNTIDSPNKRYNPYAYNYVIDNDVEAEELIDSSLICSNFPSLEINNNKYVDIIRQIEKFSLLQHNWDGFDAQPLSNAVAEKSKIIIENIDFNFYENNNIDVKVTPYSTVVIDWYKGDNEFSLEIGKDFLGYYCDGEISKEVDKLDISNQEQIFKAINQVEKDLEKIL